MTASNTYSGCIHSFKLEQHLWATCNCFVKSHETQDRLWKHIEECSYHQQKESVLTVAHCRFGPCVNKTNDMSETIINRKANLADMSPTDLSLRWVLFLITYDLLGCLRSDLLFHPWRALSVCEEGWLWEIVLYTGQLDLPSLLSHNQLWPTGYWI